MKLKYCILINIFLISFKICTNDISNIFNNDYYTVNIQYDENIKYEMKKEIKKIDKKDIIFLYQDPDGIYIFKKGYDDGSIGQSELMNVFANSKAIILNSDKYSFFTQVTEADEKFKKNILIACDISNNIKEVKLTELNKEFQTIQKMFFVDFTENYLILFVTKFKYGKDLDYNLIEKINHIALVRKKDLKVRFYPIHNNYLDDVDFLTDQYVINGNKMILLNKQKNDKYLTFTFNLDKPNDITTSFNIYKTTAKLRVRESADTNSKILVTLPVEAKVELLETGRTDTINEIKGNWVKVKTSDGEIGWCFDGYLRKE